MDPRSGLYCTPCLQKKGYTGEKFLRKARWATVDWNLKNAAIAALLGVSEGAVSYQRSQRAPGSARPRRPKSHTVSHP